MKAMDQLLLELADGLPADASSASAGLVLEVEHVLLGLPVEARLSRRSALDLSLPRSRMATGFDPPLSRISARFERGSA